jgi:DNA-binding response OmpR family regulator
MPQKILLVEDDNTMLVLLRTLLRFEGFDVAQLTSEDNLDQIMQTVRNEKPDIVLLDVHLRQINGFDLLRSLRQDDSLKATRVLISSGIDFTSRCKYEGANGFILKPYMPEDLIDQIRQALKD